MIDDDRQRLELRKAFGTFASGIVVVSAAYECREHGMTANSFTSVSLSPARVLICISNDARMTRVLEPGMDFGVSVLSSKQEAVSRQFAGRGNGSTAFEFTWHRGVPLVPDSLAHFICRVVDARVYGDHTMYIAAVEHFQRFDGRPLLYHAGAYCQLGSHDTVDRAPASREPPISGCVSNERLKSHP